MAADLSLGDLGPAARMWAELVFLLKVNGYRYKKYICPGGNSDLIEGVRVADGTPVALKLLRGGVSAFDIFDKERSALATLDHPNIVRLLDDGLLEGGDPPLKFYYLALELGQSDLYMETDGGKRPFAEEEAMAVIAAICDAAEFAHRKTPAIVHLDIKPQNILLCGGVWKLADFNIARFVADRGWGTEGYRSPQLQHSDRRGIGPQDDVFGLAATLYFALTGRDLPQKWIARGFLPDSPRRWIRGLDVDLDRIVMAGLHPDLAWRYRTPGSMAADLRHVMNGESITPPAEPLISRITRPIRWNPKTATAVATALIFASTIVLNARDKAGVKAVAERRKVESETNARVARKNAQEAESQRLGRLEAKYIDDMHRAWIAWKADRASEARPLIAAHEAGGSPDRPDFRGFEWHYLNKLLTSGIRVIDFGRYVRTACFSPDGEGLAVLGLWDREGVAVGYFDIGTGDSKWRTTIATGALRNDLILNTQTRATIQALTFSGDGKYVGATYYKHVAGLQYRQDPDLRAGHGIVKVWLTGTGREVFTVSDTRIGGQAIAFAPDGKSIVAGGSGNSFVVCELKNGGEIRVFRFERESGPARIPDSPNGMVTVVNNLLFSRDGKSLRYSILPRGSKVISWPPVMSDDQIEQANLGQPHKFRDVLAFSPDGRWALLDKEDRNLVKLMPSIGLREAVPAGGRKSAGPPEFDPKLADVIAIKNSPISRVAIGDRVIAAANDHGRLLGKIDAGRPAIEDRVAIRGHDGGINFLSLSPDERRLAIGGSRHITVIDVDSDFSRSPILKILSSDKQFMSGPAKLAYRSWRSLSGGNPENLLKSGNMLGKSPDGRWYALGNNRGDDGSGQQKPEIQLFDAAAGKERATRRFQSPVARIFNLAISPDGSECAITGDDEADYSKILRSRTQFGGGRPAPTRKEATQRPLIHIVDTRSGGEKRVLDGSRGEIRWIKYLGDGKRIASTSESDRVIRIWSPERAGPPLEFNLEDRAWLSDLPAAGDGLIAGDRSGVIKLWSLDQGTLLARYTCEGAPVWACHGSLIAILEGAGRIQLWDLKTNSNYGSIECSGKSISDLAFFADGSRLMTCEGSHVGIWSVKMGREIFTLPNDFPKREEFHVLAAALDHMSKKWKK